MRKYAAFYVLLGFAINYLLNMVISTAEALPLQTIGTFCSTFPDQCMKGTESLLAVRGTGTNAYYVLEADPTSGAIPVSASVDIPSVGPTGAAVPSEADYQGLNNGGNLIGAIGDSSGRTIVAGAGTAGTAAGGVLTIQGVASMTVLKVDGSAVTQPISGTVTANAGSGTFAISAASLPSPLGRAYADSVRYSYGGGSVDTTTWQVLIITTAAVINCVTIFDSSGQTLELGTGAAASETRVLILPPGGLSGCIPLRITTGTRVSIRALSGTASTGEFDMTGLQ